ncbi:MAG: hypothetical protein AAB442_01195 [Patescibacteria group bacterium]
MNDELTNLLPLERQKALRRNYFLRFFVVSAWMTTILVMVAGILLIPTYVFLTRSFGAKQAHLASLTSAVFSADEKNLSDQIASLTQDAAALTTFNTAVSMGTLVASLLNVTRPGIVLSGISYTPASATKKNMATTMTLSGTAATREALRSYQLALQGAPGVSTVVLPVSAYAQSSDIAFSITLTLAP